MSTNKRVRIVNNGESRWTQITNEETGEEIPRVTAVSINLDVDRVPTATITTHMPVIDVIVDAEIRHICPCCGRPVEEKQ